MIHKYKIKYKYSYLRLQERRGGPVDERDGGLLQTWGVLSVQLPHAGGHPGDHHMSEASRCCEYHHHDIITVITRPQVCDPCLGDGACNEKICERNTIVVCKTVHQVCLYHHHRSIYFTITLIGFLSSSSNLKIHRIISYHHISHHIVSQLQILNEKDDRYRTRIN